MLYREIIAVYSEIHTKHIKTLCGQNVEFVNVKPFGTYSDHWSSQGQSHNETAVIVHKMCSVLYNLFITTTWCVFRILLKGRHLHKDGTCEWIFF